jgi:outer membrane protein assembly factor BamB
MNAPRRTVSASLLLALFVPHSSARTELPTAPDAAAARILTKAKEAVAARDWKAAIETLQGIVERDPDGFVEVSAKGPDGRELKTLLSARAEALRLLESFPAEGRRAYEQTFGASATKLLTAARSRGDIVGFMRLYHRYPITDAGIEALREAAERLTHDEEKSLAASFFEGLRKHRPEREWSDSTLFHAAVALRAGGHPDAGTVEKELLQRVGPDADLLRAELERAVLRNGPAPGSWLLFGGDASRSAVAPGAAPTFERVMAAPTIEGQQSLRDRLRDVTANLESAGKPVLPAAVPLAGTVVNPRNGKRTPIVCYRSHWGLLALDLNRRRVLWKTPMDSSLERLMSSTNSVTAVSSWLDSYAQTAKRPEVLLENSTIGTLSSDGILLFAVDDIPVPPTAGMLEVAQKAAPDRFGLRFDDKLRDAIAHSRLRAYGLADGKLRWEQGANYEKNAKELRDSYFLGPPLPVNGNLYMLTEKAQELRLVTLDARTGKLQALQPLGLAPTKLAEDPLRRLQAAHPAYARGILVCPTNAGKLVGVHVATGAVRWTFSYAEPVRPAPPGENPALLPAGLWKMTGPVIRYGNVFFTAPDSDAVHCVNLLDGAALWRHKRQDGDLYMAGVASGKVLIVGTRSVRALRVETGEPAWTLKTGMPSGRGTFDADGRYYLPLAKSGPDGKAALVTLDVATGTVTSVTPAPKNEVPGNLVFFDGLVLSQTATEMVVYPQIGRRSRRAMRRRRRIGRASSPGQVPSPGIRLPGDGRVSCRGAGRAAKEARPTPLRSPPRSPS